MAKYNLLDNWKVKGHTIEGLCRVADYMAAHTNYVSANTADWSLLVRGYSSPTGYHADEITPEGIAAFNEYGLCDFPECFLPYSDFDKDLVAESVNEAGFMITYKNAPYFISPYAISSIIGRAGLHGDSYNGTLTRNMFLAERLYSAGTYHTDSPDDCNCMMVVKEAVSNKKIQKKVFFVPTEKYVPTPITAFSDCVMKLVSGGGVIHEWSMTHFLGEIVVRFPAQASSVKKSSPLLLTPGLVFRFSDTGQTSSRISLVAFVGGSDRYVILDSISYKHRGHGCGDLYRDAQVLLSSFNLSDVFQKIDDSLLDRSSLPALFNSVSRQVHLSGVIGKKREMAVRDIFVDANPRTPYEAAVTMVTLQDRLDGLRDLPEEASEQLAECCGKMPCLFAV